MSYAEAIRNHYESIDPNLRFGVDNRGFESLFWKSSNDTPKPNESEFNEIVRVWEEETRPMLVLRSQRNQKLAETDWMSFPDSPTMSAEWVTYRQTLRDLPSTASPSLDEDGNLTNVTWPTKG